MKKLVLLMVLVLFVSLGFAAVDWCGNIWPNSGTGEFDSDTGIDVYVQVYKDGVTPGAGQGVNISASLFIKKSTEGSYGHFQMSYFGEVGNNDEYKATIPSSVLNSGDTIHFYIEVVDFPDISNATDQNGAGPFTSSNPGSYYIASEAPTPICLASFVANANQGNVVLEWTTASETENSHFLIYRDGVVIAEVAGNGTCTEPHDYSYLDTRVQAGNHSYAIADVSYGGEEVMHDAVSVEVGAALAEASFVLNKAFPNPFNPLTTIDYYMSRGVHLDLGVYNMQGDKVYDLYNGLQEAGTHTAIWDANGFPSGIYFVRMIAGDMVQTMKVVLMK